MKRRRAAVIVLAAALLATGVSCTQHRWTDATPAGPAVKVVGAQTVEGLGAGQGASVHGRFVYLYGDADTGVIRQYRYSETGGPRLTFTGREILLTRDGDDLVAHPTGLTFDDDHGVFLGDTVGGRGVIHHIDWDRALADGNLDHAVLNTAVDDLAVNGCRPEYVDIDGRRLIATADYGDTDNAVRLYDPAALAKAAKTSDDGVLVARRPCGAFVQSMEWIDDAETLVLARNQVAGLRYRLTFVRFDDGADFRDAATVDLNHADDELEGFVMLDADSCLMFNSSARRNVWFAEIDLDGRR